MRSRIVFAVGLLVSVLSTPVIAQAPTCSVLDLAGRPATSFRAGAEFVVSGSGLPANQLVLVTFRQPPDEVELARYKTDAAGAFTSQPRIIRIPADATSGRAAIHLASSDGSATCDVQVVGAPGTPASDSPGPTPTNVDDLSPWFVAWATLLALGALVLVYASVRRWRLSRLERQMSRAAGAEQRTSGGRRLGDPRDE